MVRQDQFHKTLRGDSQACYPTTFSLIEKKSVQVKVKRGDIVNTDYRIKMLERCIFLCKINHAKMFTNKELTQNHKRFMNDE